MAVVPLLLLSILITLSCILAINEDVHLLHFKESLKDSSSLDSTWIPGTNPCDRNNPWRGVDCSNTAGKSVSSLLLMNIGLFAAAAEIDIEALSNLRSLRFLSLENNSFYGPIPEFNRLGSLKSLFLSGNNLSGGIPPDFFNKMRSLKRIHLSRNSFSGEIPESLTKLVSLTEVLLQHNYFSGRVPAFNQKSLLTIDLSYNKLEGEIPNSLSKFPGKAFEANLHLCGSVISRPCNIIPLRNSTVSPSPAESIDPEHESNTAATKWIVLAIVTSVLLVTILCKNKKDEESIRLTIEEHVEDQPVHVQVHTLNRRSSRNNKRLSYKDAGSQSYPRGLLTSTTGKSSNDLVSISDDKLNFGLADLMKAAADVLGSSALGSSYKAVMANGATVVVKRMKKMNDLSKDDFHSVVGKLGSIRHRNIHPPLAYVYRKEEKLFVSAYISGGSLFHVLHDGRDLNWATRLKIIKGIGRGMGYLHTELSDLEVPHGNLKSSNILLSQNNEPLLTDYGMYSLICGTKTVQSLFACRCPEAVLYQQLSAKSDVYCFGIVILEMMTRKFVGEMDLVEWVRQAVSENRLSEVIDAEMVRMGGSVKEMEKMVEIGVCCIGDQEVRIEMREAIRRIEEVQIT